MTLSAGARLGPYEVVGALGAGGMGEVYRTRDTKLNREVALKILPAEFTHDPERLPLQARSAGELVEGPMTAKSTIAAKWIEASCDDVK